MDKLQLVQKILNNAGVEDDVIRAGVNLTDDGLKKLAKRIGVSVKDAEHTLNQLVTQMRKSTIKEDEQFSYEVDFVGNVTVTDNDTGDSRFFRASQGIEILNDLRYNDEQETLKKHFLLNEDQQMRGGAGALILALSSRRILLAHRSDLPPPYDVDAPGSWSGFGGSIDPGETPIKAAQREIREEAGFSGKVEKVIPLYVFRSRNFTYYNFLVTVKDEFVPKLNWENQGYGWCTLDDLPSPMHPGMQKVFADGVSISKIKTAMYDKINESFEKEIASDVGTFNFPWKVGSKNGFATASFSGNGPNMKIKIVTATDKDGNKIDQSPMKHELYDQALEFIKSMQ